MTTGRRTRQMIGKIIASLLMVAVVILLLWPGLAAHFRWNQIISALFNWMHFPAGVLIFVLLCRRRADGGALAGTILLLWILEYLQQFMGRGAQVVDALQGSAGAVCAFMVMGWTQARGAAGRTALGGGAVVLLLAGLMPVFSAWADYVRMYRCFPLIAGFETAAEMRRWEVSGGTLERVPKLATEGRYAAHLAATGADRDYVGMFTDQLVRDWRGMSALCLDVLVPHGQRPRLWVRVDDQMVPQPAYGERFQKRLVLPSGWNRIRIPRSELEVTPSGRRLELEHVARMGVFLEAPEAGTEIYVDNIRLEMPEE